MGAVNCSEHGKHIGVTVCEHILYTVASGKKIGNLHSITYNIFPEDIKNAYIEHLYCTECAIKYKIPGNVIITVEAITNEQDQNMFEEAQEKLTIMCPVCLEGARM